MSRIIRLSNTSHSRWNDFVHAHPAGSFFHLAQWHDLIHAAWGHEMHYLAYENDAGVLEGILPLAYVNSVLFGKHLKSLPGVTHAGLLTHSEAAALALTREAEKIGQALSVDSLELRHVHATTTPPWPTQDLYVRFRKTMADDSEAILADIPRKQRAEVRKGINAGCQADFDLDNRRFFALYADNVHRHGTPGFSLRYFDLLRTAFPQQVNTFIVQDPQGNDVSGVLSFTYKNQFLPYYAGDKSRARALSANDFKYYALMCQARQQGFEIFDYGRSKQGSGPFQFKKNWGFVPEPLVYEYGLLNGKSVPENNPNNPKYQLLIKTWRKLPLSLVTRLGPLLSRHLA
jgi:FemAB-related protein (PEP-CTERM system-associated)